MRSNNFKRLTVIFLVAVVCLLTKSPTYPFTDVLARDAEIQNVQEALSLYFAEHGRYPESLDIFFEQSLLQRDSQMHIDYAPVHDYGSYRAGYKDEDIFACFGPPLSEEARNVKLMRMRDRLMSHFRGHGHFPRDLCELELRCGSDDLAQEIREGYYPYSVSENLRSFTLDGEAFEAPSPHRISVEYWDTRTKIGYLAISLTDFKKRNSRYPNNFEEFADFDYLGPNGIKKLILGEDIKYEVSADGKSAYLNGKNVVSIVDAHDKCPE